MKNTKNVVDISTVKSRVMFFAVRTFTKKFVGMGNPLAPTLANFFLGHMENQLFGGCVSSAGA